MRIELPPLTLRGALVLRGGTLGPGDVHVVRGLIGSAQERMVDLEGFAVMPGAVDIGGLVGPGGAVPDVSRAAAASGTTTLWIGVDWPDRREGLADVAVSLADLGRIRSDAPVDLHVRLNVGTHALETADELLQVLPSLEAPLVVLKHPSERVRAEVEGASGGAGRIARHLCRLADTFDALRIRYATEGDPDGDTRERYSMIGARMALRPGARGAAASARAMEAPVVLGAAEVLEGGQIGRSLAARLLAEGLCDGLAAFGDPAGPRRVVRRLVNSGRMDPGHAWALLSSGPAGIMRLADRGGIVEGTRADLAIIEPETLAVVATLTKGALVHATPAALERFRPALEAGDLAAE